MIGNELMENIINKISKFNDINIKTEIIPLDESIKILENGGKTTLQIKHESETLNNETFSKLNRKGIDINNINKIEQLKESESVKIEYDIEELKFPWTKLDKLKKQNRLFKYADILALKYNLIQTEKILLKNLLINCKIKIEYDIFSAEITNIPSLKFNEKTRNFHYSDNKIVDLKPLSGRV